MNIKLNELAMLILSLISLTLTAQTEFEDLRSKEVTSTQKENDANYPCITTEQYKEIEKRCNENVKAIFGNNPIKDHIPLTLLKWPLRAAKGLTDCSYYFISAGVDHDKATTTFKDYNCGSNTYDGHRGTDIATGPFPFYKMDNNQVEVIAAAAGTIIDKHDGEFDKNCPTVSGNPTANYIVLQHSDGSRTLYLHVKKNSLTAKTIGQSVVAEEFLAIVGSSGNSTGPHLHFEVWAGSTVSTLVDPFMGNCNILNTSSWWLNQKPYLESGLIKASTHTTDIIFPTCPATETLNESTSFAIPFQGSGLPAGFAKFYIFLRHEIIGMTADMQILNPNGTLFQSWTYTSTTNAKLNARAYSKKLPTIPGKYLFQAVYNNTTCSQSFEITNVTSVDELGLNKLGFQCNPNPFNSTLQIHFNKSLKKGELNLLNEFGKIVKSIKNITGSDYILERGNLNSGFYFIKLIDQNEISALSKIIKLQ